MAFKSFSVALLNAGEFARELGKKGTSTDFTIYDIKQGNNIFGFFDPHQYPDKIQSLANVLMLTDFTILVVKQLDMPLGEMVIALDLMKKDKGLVIFDEYVEKDKFAAMVKGTSVEKFEVTEKRSSEIYEKLTQHEAAFGDDSGLRLNIDAYFDVKSIGTVILGIVKGSTLSMHDKLQLYPSKKLISIRSIQVHDEDVKEATAGSRVGLALKDAKVDELDRGMILAKPGSLDVANEISVDAEFSKYYKEGVETGRSFFVAIGMQYRQAKVTDVKESGGRRIIRIQMQMPTAFKKGERILIVDPNAKTRICGAGTIVG